MGIVSILMAVLAAFFLFFPFILIFLESILKSLNLLPNVLHEFINYIGNLPLESIQILYFISLLFSIIGIILGCIAIAKKKGHKATRVCGLTFSCIIAGVSVIFIFVNSLIISYNNALTNSINNYNSSNSYSRN